MLDRHHRPPPAHPALPTGWNNRDQIHSPLKGTGMICTITSANWPFGKYPTTLSKAFQFFNTHLFEI